MSYFVTGATGFIGRFLVEELLEHREGQIHVLVREGSLPRMERMIERWETDRVVPVVGDLSAELLGVDAQLGLPEVTDHRHDAPRPPALGEGVQTAPRAIPDQHEDLAVAVVDELLHEVSADEAGGAGHEVRHDREATGA